MRHWETELADFRGLFRSEPNGRDMKRWERNAKRRKTPQVDPLRSAALEKWGVEPWRSKAKDPT
jgi:hypothetical protein